MKNTVKRYPELQNFFDFPDFNRIQKECLPKIMDRDDNIIVSAPTSSGKTVLFQLAILKYSKLPSPMCLYLAPIKSLCHEKYNAWNKKFRSKLSVAEVTGDTSQNDSQMYLKSHITIGTPQKIDFLSRQSLEYLKKIRLLLIDEIHMLNFQQRGATLEAIVSRIMSLNNQVRIIAVSATIPNIYEVAEWLRVPSSSTCIFGDQFRPVKINKIVLGFKNTGNPFTFQRSLNFKLLEAIRLYSDGKGSLIFCPTQKGTQSACQQIISQMKERQFIENDKQLMSLIQAAKQVSNNTLQMMLPQGLAFHNASLSSQDRSIVQGLFLQLKIKILCTTSTLSMGINLPARLVIIKSTQSYKGSMRGYQQYTRIQIDQMLGRAGRPPFDTEGTVVIMTEKNNYNRYNNTNQLQNLESQLFTQMLQHLNAQISLGTISSLQDVEEYIYHSFCYIRMKKSPSNYGIVGSIDQYIKNSCRKAVESLAQLNIINFNHETLRLYPRPLSNSISRSAVQIKSIANITKCCRQITTEREYLHQLCKCQQIGRYTSKVQQRKTLKLINQKNKYSLKQAISTPERKSFVLSQAQLSKKHIQFWELRRQASDILTLLKRLNFCVKTLGLQLKIFWLYYWALRFQKYLIQKFWQLADGQILLQLTGLEDKSKLLNARGIKTITDLKSNIQSISTWLQKSKDFTTIIKAQLNNYQQNISVSISKQPSGINLKVAIKGKFIGKYKGVYLCVGDSKNSLYYNKYLNQYNNEVNITFPKGAAIYKIGFVKDGIIGFDQFYLLENQTISKFNIDQIELKVINNRKSVENIKSITRDNSIKQRKSKSHEFRQSNFNQKIANRRKSIKRQFENEKFESNQRKNHSQMYSADCTSEVKRSKQLRLPQNYRIRKPLQHPNFQQDELNKKQIKLQDKFKYKPLKEYKWKPGFQEISSSEEQERHHKKLKLVQSKYKVSFLKKDILNRPPSIKRENTLERDHNSKVNAVNNSKNKQRFASSQNQDVFAYFYNLF